MIRNAVGLPSNKCFVELETKIGGLRNSQWGKYTMINVERPDKLVGNEITKVWID